MQLDDTPLLIPGMLTLPSKNGDSVAPRFGTRMDEWPTYTHMQSIYRSCSLAYYVACNPATLGSSLSQERYGTILRKLASSSGVYALASFVSPLIALVLAPFLTHTLSHEEYGALTVLNTAIALIAGITQFGLGSAFFRAYSCDFETPQDRLGVLSMVVQLLSLGAVPTASIIFLTAPSLSTLLLGNQSYTDALRIAAGVVLLQNLTVPGFSWLRAESKAALFSVLSIANLLVNLGTTLLLVGHIHMGLKGALIAAGCGYACVVLCTLPLIMLRAGLRVRRDIALNLLSFGLPLVSNFVSLWVLQLADRYLLSRFSSLAETASYGVSYTLGGILSVLVLSPFILAWPSALFTIAKRKDAAQLFRLIFRWFSIVLLVAGYGLSLLSTTMLKLFFPPSYYNAAPVIPIVVLSLVFYGLYNIVTVGISVQRKTWFTVIFTGTSALANVLVNIVLIPHLGAMGAAAATLVAYILLALLGYISNQRIYPVPFEVLKFGGALLIGIAFYLTGQLLAQGHDVLTTLAINCGLCSIYAACLIGTTLVLQRHTKEIPQS